MFHKKKVIYVTDSPCENTVNDVRRKLYTVEIHSTVGKRAKRMPDPTVETTECLFFLVKRGAPSLGLRQSDL